MVKTRIQIDPALARDSLLSAGRKIVAAEGTKGLLTGFGPTAVGYFFQGGGKSLSLLAIAGRALMISQVCGIRGERKYHD